MDNLIELMNNENVHLGLTGLLVVYSTFGPQRLSNDHLEWIDNDIVRLVLLLIVALLARRNATLGIMSGIAVLLTLNRATTRHIEKMEVQNTPSHNAQRLSQITDSNEILFVNEPAGVPEEDLLSEERHAPFMQRTDEAITKAQFVQRNQENDSLEGVGRNFNDVSKGDYGTY